MRTQYSTNPIPGPEHPPVALVAPLAVTFQLESGTKEKGAGWVPVYGDGAAGAGFRPPQTSNRPTTPPATRLQGIVFRLTL